MEAFQELVAFIVKADWGNDLVETMRGKKFCNLDLPQEFLAWVQNNDTATVIATTTATDGNALATTTNSVPDFDDSDDDDNNDDNMNSDDYFVDDEINFSTL